MGRREAYATVQQENGRDCTQMCGVFMGKRR
jgi:hypothetical protein